MYTNKKSILQRTFCLFVAMILVLSGMIFISSERVSAAGSVYYVSASGNDSFSGTAKNPLKTLSAAYKKAVVSGGTIVLMGDVESGNAEAWNSAITTGGNHTQLITITGKDPATGTVYENATLRHNSPVIKGPTKIEYLTLCASRDYAYINARQHELIIGEGIAKKDYNIYVHCGVGGTGTLPSTKFELNSGSLSAVYLAGSYLTVENAGITGNCEATINGGEIVGNLYIGYDTYDNHKEGFVNGNVVITINGGNVSNITHRLLANNTVGGYIAVIFNNNTIAKTDLPSAQNGVYIIKSGTNGLVSATGTPGLFTYTTGSRFSCYVDGKKAEDGQFSVTPGEHVVSFRRNDDDDFMGAYAGGFPDGSFRPEEKLTRAQAIELVVKAANKTYSGKASTFTDISKSDWYYNSVSCAQENNFLPEEWGNVLSPNANITRGEFVYIVDYALVRLASSAKAVEFTDVPESHTYYEAIMNAQRSGCVEGYGDGTFRPEGDLTRAEAVTIINRFLARTPEEGVVSAYPDAVGHWAQGQIMTASTEHSEGLWTHDTEFLGKKFEIPADAASAEDYIPALHAQSGYLSSEAIRDGVDTISDRMKQDILNSPNTADIYGDRITGKTYKISPNGSDNKLAHLGDVVLGPTPYKTIAGLTSNVTLKSGDAVLFERGSIYRGTFTVVAGVTYGAYGTGNKPILTQSAKNYANSSLWVETEWENVWKCTDQLTNVGVIAFDHDVQNYGEGCYDELYGIIMNKDLFNVTGPESLCGDLQFYSDIESGISAEGDLYVYSTGGNPGTRFSSIEIGEKANIINGTAANVVIDNLSFKFVGGHGMGGAGGCQERYVTNCVWSWIGGSILSKDFHGNGRPVNYGNAVEVYGGCNGYYVENNWMYQIYDTAVTHQRSASTGDCIQENISYSKNLMEYCFWGIEFYNTPPSADQLASAGKETDDYTRVTRNVMSDYNVLRLGGYGWGSIVRYRTSQLYCGSTLSENYDCYAKYNIFDRATGSMLNLRENSNEIEDSNIYIQTLGRPWGVLKTNYTTYCDYNSVSNIRDLWGDENAVIVLINPEFEPVELDIPDGLANKNYVF